MPGTDLVPVDQRSTFALLPEAHQLAQAVAKTEFVPSGLRNRPEAVMACVLAGHEMGIGPMQALAKIHVIEGRPAPAAELMRAIVLAHGHDIWVEESTITKVTLCGKRAGSEHTTKVTWTMDDAKKANLSGRQNWSRYPRAMLLARATGELCRSVFPDVLAGLSYSVEEVTDGFDPLGDEEPAPAETPTETRKAPGARRAAPAKRQAAPKAPPATVDDDLPPLPGEDIDGDIIDAEIVEDGSEEPKMANVEDPRLLRTIAAKVTEVWPCDDAPRGTKTKARDRIRYTLTHGVTKGRTVHLDELTWREAQELDMLLDLVKDGHAEVDIDGEALVVSQPSGFLREVPWVEVDEVKAEREAGVAEAPAPPPPVPDEAPAPAPAAPAEGDGPHTWDVEAWRAFIKDHGCKVVATMREAQRLAAELGVPFESLADLAGDDPQVVSLAALVQVWVLEQAGEG